MGWVEVWGDKVGYHVARRVGRKRRHEGDVPYPFTVWGFGIEFFAHVAASELAEGASLDLESAQSGVESWEEAGSGGVNGGVKMVGVEGESSRPMRSRT